MKNTVRVDAGNGKVQEYKVCPLNVDRFVKFCAEEARRDGLALIVTATSERRGEYLRVIVG